MYSSGDLSRLRDIRYFRDLKFSLREISRLLDAPPERVVAAMEQQFHVVEQALKEYRRAYAALDSILGAGGVQSRAAGHLAVIGIDLQNDILQGGALPCRRIEGLIPVLSELYQDARRRNIPIIYVCDCHKQGDPELELWNDHMMEGTWGAQIIRELAPQPRGFHRKQKPLQRFCQHLPANGPGRAGGAHPPVHRLADRRMCGPDGH